MRYIISLFFILTFAFSQQIEVSADNFSADETGGIGRFSGNVVIKKAKDMLKSNSLTITFNEKKQPLKYEAFGDASIKVFMDEKEYFGKGEILSYDPIQNTYIIEGNAFFEELTSKKKVYGNKIIVNQKNGKYEVKSKQNEPVKFVFEVEDKSLKQIKK